MIVKVQRALYDNEILVYDEGKPNGNSVDTDAGPIPEWVHEIYAQLELEPAQIDAILGDDLKGYFEASMQGTEIVIGDRVDDQEW